MNDRETHSASILHILHIVKASVYRGDPMEAKERVRKSEVARLRPGRSILFPSEELIFIPTIK